MTRKIVSSLVISILWGVVLAHIFANEAHAHGLAGRVADHHKWINMAVRCETKGIPDRWTLGPGHPRWNGHDGGVQFKPSTWWSTVRNRPRLRQWKRAHLAPVWAQLAAANILKRKSGLKSQWSCWRYFR